MSVSVTEQRVLLPSYLETQMEKLANTLGTQLGRTFKPPTEQVAGFSPTQEAAMVKAFQGIDAFRPFIDAAMATQTAGLGTLGAGAQTVAGADFGPGAGTAFMDQYQKDVTQEALKEIDRQQQIAENRLAGQAVQAGAFGGSRFGVAQSELARNAQDLRSRRIFEDLSRNFQQAQAAARAANQQRIQAGQVFGQLGTATGRLGGAMAGLGGQLQQQQAADVGQLMGIGSLQQQQLQRELSADFANQLRAQQAPFETLSAGANILQALSPTTASQQTIAPLAQTNPYAQAAGILTGGAGLAGLLG
jgi:hypothetical protein